MRDWDVGCSFYGKFGIFPCSKATIEDLLKRRSGYVQGAFNYKEENNVVNNFSFFL